MNTIRPVRRLGAFTLREPEWGFVRRIGLDDPLPHVPFGWVARNEWYSGDRLITPRWCWLAYVAWTRRWRAFIPLIRLGLWDVEEGCFISSGRWRWDWWNSRNAQWARPRWAAFGKRLFGDWQQRMPDWAD